MDAYSLFSSIGRDCVGALQVLPDELEKSDQDLGIRFECFMGSSALIAPQEIGVAWQSAIRFRIGLIA
jgi:hypothetical protein